MPESERLLELIEDGVVGHGGDLAGWMCRTDDSLQLFDGRVTLCAEVKDSEPPRDGSVHAHVFTTLHEHDDEVLDACLCGIAEDRQAALGKLP